MTFTAVNAEPTFISNFAIGVVDPIPTFPVSVVVMTVPPTPTAILSPVFNKPSTKENLVSVLKSSDPTNNTSFSFPAGATLIVTPTPVISTTVPASVGVCPIATLSCFNTPVPSKVPETLVKVTIPLFVVANFTTPEAELEA